MNITIIILFNIANIASVCLAQRSSSEWEAVQWACFTLLTLHWKWNERKFEGMTHLNYKIRNNLVKRLKFLVVYSDCFCCNPHKLTPAHITIYTDSWRLKLWIRICCYILANCGFRSWKTENIILINYI